MPAKIQTEMLATKWGAGLKHYPTICNICPILFNVLGYEPILLIPDVRRNIDAIDSLVQYRSETQKKRESRHALISIDGEW